MKILKPKRLTAGDVIGVISPASPIADPSAIQSGVRYLESLGYRTLVGKHAEKKDGYLAGTDKERLTDLHAMFRNRRVKAIFCVRGGYGTPRLLHSLNYDLIRRHPKILVGFSDITALHLALWRMCGLVTFSGPMVGVDMSGKVDAFTEENFWRMISHPEKSHTMTIDPRTTLILHKGKARGKLLGGNLSLVANLIGTPFIPDFRNCIMFLEEVGEEPYRVDRMFTQLSNAGILRGIGGVLAGQFADCLPKGNPESPTIDAVLQGALSRLRVPVLANLPFGHQPRKLTLPLGVNVLIEAGTPGITLLESPVAP
jgi:muramoyltetrapeptide carboxypeptidase